ncbi:hypothetical protein B4114_1600 [Geobacillus stearothermophilus]|uniref:Uncharacterized protein n=1 Tax=Geobacillus stearothermophilus TaxID=1422 RepID=A0A150N708_GEOSE|nr:hypothetical protein B4114_1600 [Geobacillus stearothermophilus]
MSKDGKDIQKIIYTFQKNPTDEVANFEEMVTMRNDCEKCHSFFLSLWYD